MSFVRSTSQLSLGGADQLPHYTEPCNLANAPSQQFHTGVPVTGYGAYMLNSTGSTAFGTPVHPNGPSLMPASRNLQSFQQGSPASPSMIGTPINAASTLWRTQVCPQAPKHRYGINERDDLSSPATPLDKWPSNIGTPMIMSSLMSGVPNPDALRFAICGAKLDLAGESTVADASEKGSEAFSQSPVTESDSRPILSERKAVPAINCQSQPGQMPAVTKRRRTDKARFHTTQPRFTSGLDTVLEMCDDMSEISPMGNSQMATLSNEILGIDITNLDSHPWLDGTVFESPEKLVAPVRRCARNMPKLEKKLKSKYSTN